MPVVTGCLVLISIESQFINVKSLISCRVWQLFAQPTTLRVLSKVVFH